MTTYDGAGRLVVASPAFIETFGPEVQEYYGRRPPYPWWPESRRPAMMEIFDKVMGLPRETFQGIEMVIHLQAPDGTSHSHAVSCERLADGSTVVVGRPLVEAESVARAIDLLRESVMTMAGEELAEPDTSEQRRAEQRRTERLSPRERNVYRLLVEGSSAAKIADTLFLSVHTVRNHRKAIYRKLGVSSQIELIRANSAR